MGSADGALPTLAGAGGGAGRCRRLLRPSELGCWVSRRPVVPAHELNAAVRPPGRRGVSEPGARIGDEGVCGGAASLSSMKSGSMPSGKGRQRGRGRGEAARRGATVANIAGPSAPLLPLLLFLFLLLLLVLGLGLLFGLCRSLGGALHRGGGLCGLPRAFPLPTLALLAPARN